MADPNPMLSYVTPERRRRMGNAMMAEQYAENPPQLPPGYDWNGAPLSPELLAFAAQRDSANLMHVNGGRPGAALGPIGGVSAQEKAIEDILGQYGIDQPSSPASPQYRPGDA